MADSIKDDVRKAGKHPRVRPWLLAGAELPATFAAHHAWGGAPAAAVGLTVAAGVVTAATWWAGEGTTRPRRIHATASAAAASTYLVVGTISNPLSPGLLSTLIIGGATVAITWNARQVLRVNPDTKAIEKGAAETGVLTKAIGNAKVALRGAPRVEPNKVTAPLQLAPGELSTDQLGNSIKQIASELGVSPTSIRIIPDPDRADRATLIVVPKDMLKEATPWEGPSSLGGSITEPVEIGVYEDGQPAQMWFPAGPGRNATHYLAAGMNGSGKSFGVSVAATEALTRRDVIMWAIDPSKGLQTFAPFLPYLDWVEMSMTGGEAMITALTKRVITARADEMGRHGFKNWTPEVFDKLGMPYMIVWIEEAAKFFRDGTEMEGMVMEARSAGISVIISLQRPSASSMPTDVREQLGGALCFGVKGSSTADMALPEDVRDAGARPEAWQNRRPGYAYLVAPGVDEDRYAMPLRTFLINDAQIEGILAIAPRPAADPVTANAAGPDYARRAIHTPGADLASTGTIPEAAVDDDDQALDASIERDLADPDDDNSPTPDVDPDREIPPTVATWAFSTGGPTPPEVTTEQALAEVMALLDEFRAAGLQVVGPKDFMPHLNTAGSPGRIGRSRSWLSPVLAELADRGVHLRDTDRPGEYILLNPQLAGV